MTTEAELRELAARAPPNSTALPPRTCWRGPTATSAGVTSWRRTCRTRRWSTWPVGPVPGWTCCSLDTGYHFAETIGTRDAVEAVYDVTVVNVTPEHRPNRICARQDLFARDPHECCRLRRWNPGRALKPADAWVTGIRRVESPPPTLRSSVRRGVRPGEDQPAGRLVPTRDVRDLRRHPRRPGEPAGRRGLSVHRLCAVHRQAGGGRRPAQHPTPHHAGSDIPEIVASYRPGCTAQAILQSDVLGRSRSVVTRRCCVSGWPEPGSAPDGPGHMASHLSRPSDPRAAAPTPARSVCNGSGVRYSGAGTRSLSPPGPAHADRRHPRLRAGGARRIVVAPWFPGTWPDHRSGSQEYAGPAGTFDDRPLGSQPGGRHRAGPLRVVSGGAAA